MKKTDINRNNLQKAFDIAFNIETASVLLHKIRTKKEISKEEKILIFLANSFWAKLPDTFDGDVTCYTRIGILQVTKKLSGIEKILKGLYKEANIEKEIPTILPDVMIRAFSLSNSKKKEFITKKVDKQINIICNKTQQVVAKLEPTATKQQQLKILKKIL